MSVSIRSIIIFLAASAPLAVASGQNGEFTQQFPLAACSFRTQGGNDFFRLDIGRQQYFSNVRCVAAGECEELEEVWITVLPETRVIHFFHGEEQFSVRTRIVEEFETEDGELDEISRNYFASCAPMNDVYYFGEDVTDGEGNPEDDAWLAGVDGAQPGLIMPDRVFLLGSRYYQEIAPTAQDRAEHTALGLEVEVPAGVFRDCVEVTETSPLEPGEESIKIYCPEVGMVKDDDLELIAIFRSPRSPSAEE